MCAKNFEFNLNVFKDLFIVHCFLQKKNLTFAVVVFVLLKNMNFCKLFVSQNFSFLTFSASHAAYNHKTLIE